MKEQGYIILKKSIFNKIIGDSHLELEFAQFLEGCDDVISYIKNYMAVNFRIDYDIYVDEENFQKFKPSSFDQLIRTFREYKD